ncbi:MAG: geranylgeranyl reductase family protein [Methanosarcinaceae archaeon]|nr:geranylgeranyl reductase family protein [Methanosarcinaceae archaeon]
MSIYDANIIGTGPAGATVARHVAAAGLNTLLLEKDTLPRVKTCGGAVSEYALSNLDIEIPDSIIERECFGARIRYGSCSLESETRERLSVMVSRDRFDHHLTKIAVDAGAELMEDVRVISVQTDNDCAIVETTVGTFRSKVVIGADGVNSVCAKNVRGSFTQQETSFALEAEIPASNEQIDHYIFNKGEFYFGIISNGYGWVFPKDEHFSLGIAGRGQGFSRPMDAYRDFIKMLGFDYVKPRGHFVPIGGLDRKTYSNRILLVGDAAGYVDAFLGEGIAYAIASGNFAAETVINAHQKDDFSETSLASYHKRCMDSFLPNLKYSYIFSKWFYRFPNLSSRILVNNEPLLNKFIHLATGRWGYLFFMKWIALRLPYYVIKDVIGRR